MQKVEKMHILVATVLLDTIMHQNLTLMEFKSQSVLVTFAKIHMSFVCQHFQRASPLKPPCQFY